MKISSAIVIANRRKPLALRIKKEAEGFLRSRGIAISPSSPQLVVTVGGDGTVLLSKKYYGTPFFSIGSETSFICQANFSNWKSKLASALHGFRTERRLMLFASLNGRSLPLSLNEIGIRNPEPRVLSLHLASGSRQHAARKSRRSAGAGERHYAFRADGIIFSTPTGSMAYCYSCGGREMEKNSRHYQAVAISPFRRLFRPLILPAQAACTLRLSGHERAQLFIDGQIAGSFSGKDTLKVKAGKKPFYFVRA